MKRKLSFLFLLMVGNVWLNNSAVAALLSGPEYDTLVAIYDWTAGDQWQSTTMHLKPWKSGDACNWYGITCDAQDHVAAIGLNSNNLNGSLPPLGALTRLQALVVSQNALSGNIPSLSQLTRLTIAEFAFNQLSGSIPSLAGLQELEDFNVAGNNLSGEIPRLAGLSNLKSLLVSQNGLTGKLPDDLGDITTARGTEAYLLLWVRLYGALKTGDFNIKIVKK